MLLLNPDIVNSCRICLNPSQEGDYESLFQSDNMDGVQLTDSGLLYEYLINEICVNSLFIYPKNICNSCGLQLRLFKKLKDKAIQTMDHMESLYGDHNIHSVTKPELQQAEGGKDLQLKQEFSHENQNFEPVTVFGVGSNVSVSSLLIQPHILQQQKTQVELQQTESIANECSQQDAISNHNIVMQQQQQQQQQHHHMVTHGRRQQYQESHADILISIDPSSNQILDETDYITEIYEMLDDEQDIACDKDVNQSNQLNAEDEIARNYHEFFDAETVSTEINEQHNDMEENSNDTLYYLAEDVNNDEDDDDWKCSICNELFLTAAECKRHKNSVHKNSRKYHCTLCSKSYKTQPSLRLHMKIHNSNDDDAAAPEYQCPLCSKSFNQKIHYQYHMNHHNNVRNYSCDICSKAFLTHSDLSIHQRFKHFDERPYACTDCGKSYKIMEHLKNHLLSHSAEKNYQCEVCQKQFNAPRNLKLHMQTIHSEVVKFKCDICMKPFKRKHHLEYHMKIHKKPEGINLLESHYDVLEDDSVDVQNLDTTMSMVTTVATASAAPSQCDLSEQSNSNIDTISQSRSTSPSIDNYTDIIENCDFIVLNDETAL